MLQSRRVHLYAPGHHWQVLNTSHMSTMDVRSNQRWSTVGVALVKPTTSYFWFLVTFCHNRICGLAVAFKNNILGCLPALLKIIPKMGDVDKLRPNTNNVITPPPILSLLCNDLPCIYSLVANQVMQSHGGNTSACDCIAWFLPWVDFHVKIVHHTTHDAMIVYLFSIAAQYWPSPLPNPVAIVHSHACPISQTHVRT